MEYISVLEASLVKPTTEVLIRRQQWAIDGAKAWTEYLAAPNVVAAKTARLKQERLKQARLKQEGLAREAAVMEKPKKKASRKNAATSKLSR